MIPIAIIIALAVDVMVVMPRKMRAVKLRDTYKKIMRWQLLLCAVLLAAAVDARFGIFTALDLPAANIIGWALRVIFAVLSAVIIFLCLRVMIGGMIKTARPTDRAVVLGLALEDGRPSRDLIRRLNTARVWLEKNPGCVLILSGGNAGDSGITEAAVMRDHLLERGVPGYKLIVEDRSATTGENFANTARLIPPDEPIVLVTSDYHMDRAVRTAKKAGFRRILRLPAPSGILTFGSNMLWEVVVDINDLTS